MNCWTRRQFGSLVGAACLTAVAPRVARSQASARVVVIGGGISGATVAKYLAASAAGIEVTLVEPKVRYTTCFFSALYLAGMRSLESLTHGYETLAQRYGIKIVHDFAAAIDPVAKTVNLKSGGKLPYDRLVLAPGIAFKFDAVEGYDEAATEIMPHAWIAGPQTEFLRRQLDSMEDGGVFLIVSPPNPFRCPPGPYERASLVAYYFKQFKPRSKILIFDAKVSFFEQELFQDAWVRHYPGMIESLPAQFTGGIKSADNAARWDQGGRHQGLVGQDCGRHLQGRGRQFHTAANGWRSRAAGGSCGSVGLVSGRAKDFRVEATAWDPYRGRCNQWRRHAEVRLSRQQPGQGLCLRHRGGTHRLGAFCPSFV